MDIMKKPHVILEHCTNWNLYYKTSMTGLGVCTPQSMKCQWMSRWWHGRDSCLGRYKSPQNETDFEWNHYLFELCEAKSCYVWNFIIYVGLDTAFDDHLGNEPHGPKVVLELMAPLLNQGYHVTMDNWFSSPDLYNKLYSKQTDAMGTVRQSRECLTK
jgi:hypothetical protein